MSFYTILVFLHILGAVSMFAAWGVEATIIGRLRHAATTAQAREWMELADAPRPFGPLGMLALLVTGIAMMAGWWGPRAWMFTALAGVAGIVAAGIALGRRARRPLRATGDDDGDEAERLAERSRAVGAALARSLTLRVAIGVGVLALMAAKPALPGSLAILAVAVVVGAGVAWGASRRRRRPTGPSEA